MFRMQGAKRQIFWKYKGVYWKVKDTKQTVHLQELLNVKQFITNFIYSSSIFRRRERAGDIDIERTSSTESFGWDKDGRKSIDI